MKSKEIIKLLHNVANKIEEEKDFLTKLDNEIGDGDHGVNLARGFLEVDKVIDSLIDKLPSDIMKSVGMTLISKVGGASGPLYGTAFLKLSMSFKDKEDINLNDFLIAFNDAIDGIKMRGKSNQGEKTMLDAMIPAYEAMLKENSEGKPIKEVLLAGVKEANNGVEYTKTIIATKGRASYVGERSIGHQDPGATSFTMMLEELSKVL